MRTVTYESVLNHAVELAGRTRDKLPPSEELMVRGFIDAWLRRVWTQYRHPELTIIEEMTPDERVISKRETDSSPDLESTSVRIRSGRLQLKDQDTGLWYDAVVRSTGGAPTVSTEGAGEA